MLLIQSMKNQASGVWDFGSQASDAIAKQEFSEYTDEAFEMLAWKLVVSLLDLLCFFCSWH